MTPDQPHRCTVQLTPGGAPFLAFEPATGAVSSYSNSLFTLDLREGATVEEAEALARHINGLLAGVSATVF
ncbi:hypothetical protein [Phenylobacterium zucineum]|uniref:hypothetical protein n=1 Tax=Phenylobacterium zucineum TaxID=284016 RepID=UPI0002FEBBD7|nr:hypothetical protein [Phenylobacterium zucineum]